MDRFSKFLLLSIALFFVNSMVGWSQDFQKGLNAYTNGDYTSAMQELMPLAEQGDAESQYRLGLLYAGRDAVPPVWRVRHQNRKESAKWYRLAAEQGHAKAQLSLGLMYGTGEGLVKDLVYAYMWMHISASSGDARAISGRTRVAKVMSQSQLDVAHALALECVQKKFDGC